MKGKMDRYHFSFSVNIFYYILEKKIYVRVTKTFCKGWVSLLGTGTGKGCRKKELLSLGDGTSKNIKISSFYIKTFKNSP